MHIEHAEVLICEDEFKYSLLANNCICPGISTFITLLMHTSRGEEGKKSTEPWHKVYGFHSGNEIYMIRTEDSKFFGEFIGKSFTYASFHAHKTYGIGLIGLKSSEANAKIRLNPGVSHILHGSDILYYMGLTNEESLYDFRKDLKDQRRKANLASTIANIGTVAIDVPHIEEGIKKPKLKKRGLLQKTKATDEVRLIDVPVNGSRRPSIAMVMEGKDDSSSDSDYEEACTRCKGPCIQQKIQRTYPQVRTYIGTSNTVCHMLKEKRPLCCLQLDKACEHCPHTSAYEYRWMNKPIILAADRTSSGMYNLIIPLRAYYRPVHELHPIVLLLELEETASPNPAFLDAMSYFPLIYWMQGKISVLDNLLRAGVSRAEHVVVVKETATLVEEHFADCNTIITVQKIHRMFPRLRMITELTHASNMRFVQFDANSPYSLAQSRFEKKERKRGSHMPFMFRLPFAQGGVFSANMLDRLLYQAIIKPYVVSLTRLLLGIDQTTDSGYLTSFTVTSDDLWIQTYGRLYHKIWKKNAEQ
ncbi:Calcium-activated BK potassium channel alpha subunit [Necator americanus]|uniref:Calcium-activated BK potassium channel alpha subunit n=1 Tax=Necator americanus TaxID=51031 RepID=W2TDX8_NECAM|nr:Calcium-activated BK potassium channel alpha subunit [Necator americanus]ETN79227.1 Calcium-activated BK potassium channel alpha subunit [Necator americanus]